MKGGVLGPRVLSGAEMRTLADIEPREVLLARLAGGFQAPLARAAGLFQAFTRNLAYGMRAYIDQRVAGGETAEAAGSAPPDTTDAAPADGAQDEEPEES